MNNENVTPTENKSVNEINICDEVLQSIAARTVKETEGVSLSTTIAEGIVEKIVKKSANKGVKIDSKDKAVTIDVHISVEYGLKIQDICRKLQADIKNDIETVTDLTVESVNIYVDNITIKTEDTDNDKNTTEITEQEN